MNPLAPWAAIKAGFVWVVLAVLISGIGVQTLRLYKAVANLEKEVASRATESAARMDLALHDALRNADKQTAHAAKDLGISNELAEQTRLRLIAERTNGRLSGLLNDATNAALTASAFQKAQAGSGAGECRSDQPSAIDRFFAEAGGLLARSAELSEEAQSVVKRRDAEVKALKATVESDRETTNTP
ncbi:MAG: hypothetical protein H7274_26225 [Rhodoferax sp.]|nr:hypothetical protein [Rhodoferax sp.]